MGQNKKGAGRPVKAAAPWGELARHVGSNIKLAAKLGVSTSTVNKWATGVHRVPELARREVVRLCKYYGVEEGVDQLQADT